MNHSATFKAILAILTKMHVQTECLYFLFALGIIHDDRCDRKTPKTIISFK